MTQANESSSEKAAPASVVGDAHSNAASLGDKLRAAREQRTMSLEQVAEALHLDEAIISALEQGRFDTLGAPVYVRGHLKKYARLLDLPEDSIAGEYHGGSPDLVASPTLRQPGAALATVNPVLWAGGVLAVLLGLVLGVYVLLGNDNPARTIAEQTGTAVPAAEIPDETLTAMANARLADAHGSDGMTIPDDRNAPVVADEMPERPVHTVAAEAEVEVGIDDDISVAPPANAPAPRPVATMRLGLRFNQESWVEISDANRRLLFGLQRKGHRREISGEPPFNLLIGNARGVELTINDEPYVVPSSRVRGKVARFEITDQGIE